MSKTTKSLFAITDDELLVEEVSKNRVLYDSSHEKHKDVNFKDVIWNNISSVVGQCAEDCKKRWRNIRDTYMRHKKKLGTGSSALAKKKWFLADSLTFLNNVEYERNTTTNINASDTTTNDTTTNVNTNDSFMDFLSEESSELFDEDNTTEKSTKEPNFKEFQKPNKKFKSKYNKKDFSKHQSERTVIIQNLHKQNETILNKVTNNDETDLFFQSIAAMVKKLPPRGISEARLQILKTISELEDKYLINPHIPTPGAFSTTTVSEYDYNIAHSSSTSSCQSLSSNSQGFAPFVYENNFTNQ
ncbi:uncharacterized protein LOC113559163 [Rhopalosiphum maidis]|uniref:uncharacterized protein LOC113559163 n=1 Tax=Rhopalosiphum maidis TaxID=43146 RepID=UPI000F008493|nr:uncharacterized protein LOC113559163 [Rhopalosiphum maidis]